MSNENEKLTDKEAMAMFREIAIAIVSDVIESRKDKRQKKDTNKGK